MRTQANIVGAGLLLLDGLRNFIGESQREALAEALRGEEGGYFETLLAGLARTIEAMPRPYDTAEDGENAVVRLHYFCGGWDWWITERDKTAEQLQAFGLASNGWSVGLGHCPPELGYISLEQVTAAGAELDLYWQPVTVGEILSGEWRKRDFAPVETARVAEPVGAWGGETSAEFRATRRGKRQHQFEVNGAMVRVSEEWGHDGQTPNTWSEEFDEKSGRWVWLSCSSQTFEETLAGWGQDVPELSGRVREEAAEYVAGGARKRAALPRRGPCGCRPGVERDNCPSCEGSGLAIDWRAFHAAKQWREVARARAVLREEPEEFRVERKRREQAARNWRVLCMCAGVDPDGPEGSLEEKAAPVPGVEYSLTGAGIVEALRRAAGLVEGGAK